MAKHKSGRALFEILAEERREEAARRGSQATPEPIVRRYGAGREAEAGSRRPTERPVQRTTPNRSGQRRINLTYYHLAIALVLVACAGIILFVLGTRFGGPSLPQTESRPTMEEVLESPTEPGLVPPTPAPGPAPGPAPSPAPSPAPAPTPVPAGQVRLRIARLKVERSGYTDQLRTLLLENDVETDMVARRGYFILYGRDRFPARDDPKAKEFLKKIENLLKEFEQKTGWPAATNPYFVLTREE